VAKRSRLPLFRGNGRNGVAVPDPGSKILIVEHILYLGGAGRSTPFTSTTESREIAQHFAGGRGRVWRTDPETATSQGALHVPKDQLLRDLRGFGRGRAKWTSAWEVAHARALVERSREHLLDWSRVPKASIAERVRGAFR